MSLDWVTISALATAGGTLVLAVATFASVRSANRAARAAERSMLAGLRPLLVASREQDPDQKIGFADEHWVHTPGGGATAETSDEAIYLTLSLRNVGDGIAVLHGWQLHPEQLLGPSQDHPPPEAFRRLTRDLYIAAHDVGFWQGVFRDPDADEFTSARKAIDERVAMTVDLLYGDFEGGQRVITRFGLRPRQDGAWLPSTARHWNLDRADPR
jgi:hypothetical protein